MAPDKATFLALLNQGEQGDSAAWAQAAPHLGTYLPPTHEAWARYGNGTHRVAQLMLENHFGTAKGPFSRLAIERQMRALITDLAGPTPSPLEQLLAERVGVTWLYLHLAEEWYLTHCAGLHLVQHMYHERRIAMAHSRYLAAVRSLAQIRRLPEPNVQVNIAEQQLNVAAIAPAQPHQHHAGRSAHQG